MIAMSRFNRPPSEQVTRYTGHLAELECVRTSVQARAVWAAADRDRDVERITDFQHGVVAGRAEELMAMLPAGEPTVVRIPAQRTPDGAS